MKQTVLNNEDNLITECCQIRYDLHLDDHTEHNYIKVLDCMKHGIE